MTAGYWITAMIVIAGCGTRDRAATSSSPEPSALPAPDALPLPAIDAGVAGPPGADRICPAGKQLRSTADRFDCAIDSDCVNNCMYGAINTWWDQRMEQGCDDGCETVTGPARCVAGRCVAFYYHDGKRHDACTNRPAPAYQCVSP